jgi:hypothetical protein
MTYNYRFTLTDKHYDTSKGSLYQFCDNPSLNSQNLTLKKSNEMQKKVEFWRFRKDKVSNWLIH